MDDDVDFVKILFNKKVDIECQTLNKDRPIHLALFFRNYDIVRFLI